MSHFAKVLNNKVINVIAATPEFMETFIDNSPGEWIQTSYNTHGGVHLDADTRLPDGGVQLRKNFAGIDYNYDPDADAFYAPQPFASWLLNIETFLWEAPVPMPTDGQSYEWNEIDKIWEQMSEY